MYYYYEELIRVNLKDIEDKKELIKKEINLYENISFESNDIINEKLFYLKCEEQEYINILNKYKDLSLESMITIYKDNIDRINNLDKLMKMYEESYNSNDLTREGAIIKGSKIKIEKLRDKCILVRQLILMDLIIMLCNEFLKTDINDIDFPGFSLESKEFVILKDDREIPCVLTNELEYKRDSNMGLGYKEIFKYKEFIILYDIEKR